MGWGSREPAAHGKKARRRGKVQRAVPYLPILPFNGRPLLAVGSAEFGSRGEGSYCLLLLSHTQVSPQLEQEEEGTNPECERLHPEGVGLKESLRSPLEAATQVSLTSLLRAPAGSSHPWRTICGPEGERTDNTWLGSGIGHFQQVWKREGGVML